jgi:intracellular sulfur oxidation DsrE/DsrF family protein
MRYTAKTTLERIEQHLKDHMQTYVEVIISSSSSRTLSLKAKKKKKGSLNNFLKTLAFRSKKPF